MAPSAPMAADASLNTWNSPAVSIWPGDRTYSAGVGYADQSFPDLLKALRAMLTRLSDEARKFFSPPAPPAPGPSLSFTVRPGDTLWRIAAETLGDGKRWPEIFELNRDKLSRPEDLQAGMVLRLPGAPGQTPAPPPPPAKEPPPFGGDDIAAGLNIPAAGKNPDRATIEALLDRAADKYGIPRAILKGIALRESNWRQYDAGGNPVAGRNPTTTDWGIMQINDYWHPDAYPRAKTDIVYNILYGAKYLSGQYKRYGSWPDAVAAYNAGSVQKVGGQYKNQAYVDFVLAHARSDYGWKG